MTVTSADEDLRRAEHLRVLEQEVGVVVRRVRRVIDERSRTVHEHLQPASYLMLSYLATHGPLRASAMSEVFAVDKGAISRQIQHLEDLGLVTRSPDPADGRAWLVSATDDAVERLEAVVADRRRWLAAQLSDWTEEELGDFAATMARYNRALGS